MFKASVEAANDWNTEITKLSKAMGTTAEEASVMAVALKHIGLDADAVTSASLAMTRQLSHNEGGVPGVRRANEGRANRRAEANRRHHGERQSKLLYTQPTLRSATRTGCGSMAGSGQRSWASSS